MAGREGASLEVSGAGGLRQRDQGRRLPRARSSSVRRRAARAHEHGIPPLHEPGQHNLAGEEARAALRLACNARSIERIDC